MSIEKKAVLFVVQAGVQTQLMDALTHAGLPFVLLDEIVQLGKVDNARADLFVLPVTEENWENFQNVVPDAPVILVCDPEHTNAAFDAWQRGWVVDFLPADHLDRFSLLKSISRATEQQPQLVEGASTSNGELVSPETNRSDLVDQLQRRVEELSTLQEISEQAMKAGNEDELIEFVTQLLGDVFYGDHFGVLLVDDKRNQLVVHPSYHGLKPAQYQQTFAQGEGITGLVWKQKAPIRINNVQTVTDYLVSRPDIQSEICVPLIAKDNVIGVINSESTRLNAFDENDERFLMTIAQNLAVALERLRSQAQVVQQRNYAQALSDSALALASSLDYDSTVGQILEIAQRVVSVDAVNVMVVDGVDVVMEQYRGYREIGKEATVRDLRLKVSDSPNFSSLIRTKKPVLVEDTRNSEYWKVFETSSWIKSYLGVPIFDGEDVVAFLNMDSQVTGFFNAEHVEAMTVFARQISNALRNAKLYADVVQAGQRRMILHKLSSDVASSVTDMDEIYRAVHKAIKQMIACDTFAITLVTSDSKQIKAVYLYDQDKLYPPKTIPIDGTVTGEVVSAGKSIIYQDLFTQDESKGYHYGSENQIRSVLAVPLIQSGQVMGMITTQSYLPNVFSQADIETLELLAAHVAVAIVNAQLLEKSQTQVKRLAALRLIDQAINSSMDITLTLDVLLGQVLSRLPGDAAGILLLDESQQSLRYKAARGFSIRAENKGPHPVKDSLPGQAVLRRSLISFQNANDLLATTFRTIFFQRQGFSAYYAVPLIAKGKVKGVLELFSKKALTLEPDDLEFYNTVAHQAAIAIDNAELFMDLQRSTQELQIAYNSALEGLARALEFRDYETQGHSRRVIDMTGVLAKELQVASEEITSMLRGALLHDIGKIAIPDRVLLKEGPLTEQEWDIMRKHPLYANEILSPIAYLHSSLDIPRCHHEKWDGTGYPNGLKGHEIPLAARIFALIDVYDALTSDRPYRSAWSHADAIAYIESQKGKYFDPEITDIFLRLLQHEWSENGTS